MKVCKSKKSDKVGDQDVNVQMSKNVCARENWRDQAELPACQHGKTRGERKGCCCRFDLIIPMCPWCLMKSLYILSSVLSISKKQQYGKDFKNGNGSQIELSSLSQIMGPKSYIRSSCSHFHIISHYCLLQRFQPQSVLWRTIDGCFPIRC